MFCKRAPRPRRAARRDRPRASSTSTAARWPPGTRSPRPAGASSPRWPRRCTSAARGRGVIAICAAGGQGVVAILEKLARRPHDRPLHARSSTRRSARLDRAAAARRRCRRPVRARAAACCSARAGRVAEAAARCWPARATRRPRSTTPVARRCCARRARRRRRRTRRRRRPAVQGARLRRHRDRRLDRAASSCSASSIPTVRRVERSGRVVVLGTPPEAARPGRGDRAARARGLHALARQGDRARGATVQLVYVAPGRRGPARARRCASCSRRARPTCPARWCGSATAAPTRRRSTGERRWPARSRWSPAPRAASARRSPRRSRATARTSSGSTCRRWPTTSTPCRRLGGSTLALDITDARRARGDRRARSSRARRRRHRRPQRRRHPRQDARRAWPRSAGIADRHQPLQRRSGSTTRCSSAGCCATTAAIVCVSSISGIAGNAGQTNYATSKAGVIGMVESLAPVLRRARGDDQRGRAGLHRDADDRGDADRACARRAGA